MAACGTSVVPLTADWARVLAQVRVYDDSSEAVQWRDLEEQHRYEVGAVRVVFEFAGDYRFEFEAQGGPYPRQTADDWDALLRPGGRTIAYRQGYRGATTIVSDGAAVTFTNNCQSAAFKGVSGITVPLALCREAIEHIAARYSEIHNGDRRASVHPRGAGAAGAPAPEHTYYCKTLASVGCGPPAWAVTAVSGRDSRLDIELRRGPLRIALALDTVPLSAAQDAALGAPQSEAAGSARSVAAAVLQCARVERGYPSLKAEATSPAVVVKADERMLEFSARRWWAPEEHASTIIAMPRPVAAGAIQRALGAQQ